MKSRALIATATIALVATLAASPANAAFPGTNGRIAFNAGIFPDPSQDIHTINPDGSGLVGLTGSRDFNDTSPAWSSDGTTIAYSESGRFGSRVRKMRFDGRANVLVSGGEDPSWSPDGAKLVVEGSCCTDALYVMNADGSGLQFLVAGRDPAWSPDGSKIAFTRFLSGRTDVWTISPTGSGLTNLTADQPSGSQDPNWSPDGSKIVYTLGGIRTMNADGSGKTAVSPTGSDPAWSPDGTKFAYVATNGLHTMDIDGNNDSHLLTSTVAEPDWQPCTGPCPSSAPEPHDTTGAANRAYIAFVPNFRQTISEFQCEARSGTVSQHGPPLAFTSCAPPAYLPGTVAHQGPNGESGVIYRRGDGFGGIGFGGYDTFVIEGGGTDIKNAAGGDYNPTAGADATLATFIRVTDTFNGPGLNESATGVDYELLFPIACSPDPEPEFGSTCAGATSADALLGSEVLRPDRQTVIQLFEVRMKDVGLNGAVGDSDDRPFVIQGVWIP